MKQGKDIINFARDLRDTLKTDDPYEIAKFYGIAVLHNKTAAAHFTAQTIRTKNYPTIISINDKYSDKAKRILCAHELGHALLHADGVNYFAVTDKNIFTQVEYEANLFAIALLTDTQWESTLKMPIEKMNNYLLKTIIDYNL